MSGLTASQPEKIRGERRFDPRAGDGVSQISKAGEDSDDIMDNPDAPPFMTDEPPKPIQPTTQTTLSKVQPAGKFKVQRYSGDSEAIALATFNNPWANGDWSSKKLADLRQILVSHVKIDYAFCMADKSIVPEDMPVADYFEDTASVVKPKENKDAADDNKEGTTAKSDLPSLEHPAHNIIYLKEKPKDEAVKAAAVDALKKSFMIKFVDKGRETSTGSIQSSQLSGDMNTVQLRVLRPHVNMSSDQSRHEFCLSDGTSVSDSMMLKTYISKGEVPGDIGSDLPMLTVYFQKVGRKSIFSEASDEMKERGKIETKTDLAFGGGNEKAVTAEEMAAKAADISKLRFQESFLNSLSSVRAAKYLTPAELDEMQWDIVLGNCNVMYGWKFDLNTMSVKRAPQPAFKLRKGLNLTTDSEVPQSSQVVAPAAGPADSASMVKVDDAESKDGNEDGDEDKKEDKDENEEDKPVNTPVNTFVPKRKKPDAVPNFCVVDDSKIEITLVSSSLEESMAKNNFTASSFEVGGSAKILGVNIGASGGTSQRGESGSGSRTTDTETLMIGNYRFPRASVFLRAEDLEPTEGLASAIEKVRVTKSLDQLKALYDNFGHFFCEEVLIGGRLQTTRATKITDKYSVSRAKSQFKAQVGVAISAPRIGSINGKYSKETGSDGQQDNQETGSSDAITFEATGGNTILATNPPRWTESVLDHRNWRVINRSGLTPLGQVLGRCSVVEMRQARAWFTQAVPYLSKYIAIPESRAIPVRLKLNSKIPQLNRREGQVFDRDACHYFGHQYGKFVRPIRVGLELTEDIIEQIQKEVAIGTGKLSRAEILSMIKPLGRMVQGSKVTAAGTVQSDISPVFKEVEVTEEIPIFSPARIQAPVALPFDDSDLTAGVTKDQYRETVWNMVVPYGEWLQHDSLVMLTSATGTQYKDDVWLTIYRNAQGQFMPAMTSSGDASFWRVKKGNSGNGAEISEGNTIRLTWRFSDQTAGFRDFYDDSFGRRTFNKPENVKEDELHLKLPFPGFQKTAAKDRANAESAGYAMIMSEIGTDSPILQEVAISSKISEGPQKRTYNLHDTSFRLDLVGNAGLGELEDYMTLGLDQSLTQTFINIIAVRTQILQQEKKDTAIAAAVMDPADQFGRVLIGPAYPYIAAPAKAIISKATGFFKGILGL